MAKSSLEILKKCVLSKEVCYFEKTVKIKKSNLFNYFPKFGGLTWPFSTFNFPFSSFYFVGKRDLRDSFIPSLRSGIKLSPWSLVYQLNKSWKKENFKWKKVASLRIWENNWTKYHCDLRQVGLLFDTFFLPDT